MSRKENFINSLGWGFLLWLIGYILGIIFFMIMPTNMIGWAITPIGILIILWVLFKKINREHFSNYVWLGAIWTIVAIVLDYIFNVKLFNIANYYKLDIYIYYATTFFLPVIAGWYKTKFIVRQSNN